MKNTHSLRDLWALVRTEAFPKIENDAWKEWDVDFVEQCVRDFDAVDPGTGVRFRYPGKSFGGPNDSSGHEYAWADFDRLLRQMPHVRDVLGMIDLWLYETHGQIEEWEREMGSW